jgi:hypothetical protein
MSYKLEIGRGKFYDVIGKPQISGDLGSHYWQCSIEFSVPHDGAPHPQHGAIALLTRDLGQGPEYVFAGIFQTPEDNLRRLSHNYKATLFAGIDYCRRVPVPNYSMEATASGHLANLIGAAEANSLLTSAAIGFDGEAFLFEYKDGQYLEQAISALALAVDGYWVIDPVPLLSVQDKTSGPLATVLLYKRGDGQPTPPRTTLRASNLVINNQSNYYYAETLVEQLFGPQVSEIIIEGQFYNLRPNDETPAEQKSLTVTSLGDSAFDLPTAFTEIRAVRVFDGNTLLQTYTKNDETLIELSPEFPDGITGKVQLDFAQNKALFFAGEQPQMSYTVEIIYSIVYAYARLVNNSAQTAIADGDNNISTGRKVHKVKDEKITTTTGAMALAEQLGAQLFPRRLEGSFDTWVPDWPLGGKLQWISVEKNFVGPVTIVSISYTPRSQANEPEIWQIKVGVPGAGQGVMSTIIRDRLIPRNVPPPTIGNFESDPPPPPETPCECDWVTAATVASGDVASNVRQPRFPVAVRNGVYAVAQSPDNFDQVIKIIANTQQVFPIYRESPFQGLSQVRTLRASGNTDNIYFLAINRNNNAQRVIGLLNTVNDALSPLIEGGPGSTPDGQILTSIGDILDMAIIAVDNQDSQIVFIEREQDVETNNDNKNRIRRVSLSTLVVTTLTSVSGNPGEPTIGEPLSAQQVIARQLDIGPDGAITFLQQSIGGELRIYREMGGAGGPIALVAGGGVATFAPGEDARNVLLPAILDMSVDKCGDIVFATTNNDPSQGYIGYIIRLSQPGNEIIKMSVFDDPTIDPVLSSATNSFSSFKLSKYQQDIYTAEVEEIAQPGGGTQAEFRVRNLYSSCGDHCDSPATATFDTMGDITAFGSQSPFLITAERTITENNQNDTAFTETVTFNGAGAMAILDFRGPMQTSQITPGMRLVGQIIARRHEFPSDPPNQPGNESVITAGMVTVTGLLNGMQLTPLSAAFTGQGPTEERIGFIVDLTPWEGATELPLTFMLAGQVDFRNAQVIPEVGFNLASFQVDIKFNVDCPNNTVVCSLPVLPFNIDDPSGNPISVSGSRITNQDESYAKVFATTPSLKLDTTNPSGGSGSLTGRATAEIGFSGDSVNRNLQFKFDYDIPPETLIKPEPLTTASFSGTLTLYLKIAAGQSELLIATLTANLATAETQITFAAPVTVIDNLTKEAIYILENELQQNMATLIIDSEGTYNYAFNIPPVGLPPIVAIGNGGRVAIECRCGNNIPQNQ